MLLLLSLWEIKDYKIHFLIFLHNISIVALGFSIILPLGYKAY